LFETFDCFFHLAVIGLRDQLPHPLGRDLVAVGRVVNDVDENRPQREDFGEKRLLGDGRRTGCSAARGRQLQAN
jgi:hypothetical protein